MTRESIRNVLFFTTILAIAACNVANEADQTPAGQIGVEKSGDPMMYSRLIKDMDTLPACDQDHDSQLIYVIDLQEFKVCSQGEWVTAEIGGKDGGDESGKSDGGPWGRSYNVLDANGNIIGTTNAESVYGTDVGGGKIKFEKLNYLVTNLAMDTGRFPKIPDTYWKSIDCTGVGYASGSENSLYDIDNKIFRTDQSAGEVISSMRSRISSNVSGACVEDTLPYGTIVYPVAEYTDFPFPEGTSYPFAAPLTFEQ
ncbi:MAG: hypothetical protein CMP10_17500 [Zetaproteobacteria bacterium]|nr:hypothetical protein [Pseudobdellovibrionaceae bacterium]